jgi:hypothetical protein
MDYQEACQQRDIYREAFYSNADAHESLVKRLAVELPAHFDFGNAPVPVAIKQHPEYVASMKTMRWNFNRLSKLNLMVARLSHDLAAVR